MRKPTRVELFTQELNEWDFSNGINPPDQLHLQNLHSEYRNLVSVEHHSLSRERAQGHFTASALLVDPVRAQVMLVMHPRVKRWLQMGGHIEPIDSSFREAALRECQEESGYADIDMGRVPARLDRHNVACKSISGEVIHSVHWDVQFLALVDSASTREITEDAETRWWGVQDPISGLDPSVELLIGAAREFLE